jgi:hypothetical protein
MQNIENYQKLIMRKQSATITQQLDFWQWKECTESSICYQPLGPLVIFQEINTTINIIHHNINYANYFSLNKSCGLH